jgi:hypothetical protein
MSIAEILILFAYIYATWRVGQRVYFRFSDPNQSNGKGYLIILVWVVITFLAYIFKIHLWFIYIAAFFLLLVQQLIA